jgi:hypothetical protein
MISTENIFLKNDFPETILRRKPFYTETNGALVTIHTQTVHLIYIGECEGLVQPMNYIALAFMNVQYSVAPNEVKYIPTSN